MAEAPAVGATVAGPEVDGGAADPAKVHAVALAHLPGMTPARLAGVLADGDPGAAWRTIAAGTHPADPGRRFAAAARSCDVAALADRYRSAGLSVLLRGAPRYPSALAGDPAAPAVLFARGDLAVIESRPRVAIVGTRSATPYGLRVASGLGRELAAAGVVVVSGLARGIDGAAHAGALGAMGPERGSPAPPAAVVATGLDVVYPASNRALWERVAERGVVLSERPLGAPPDRWAFAARNRILAALAHVVVVVESHRRGGSLITAHAAEHRGITVGAVPGSVLSRASEGTNALLADGCFPVRDVTDVLVAVSLATVGTQVAAGPGGPGGDGGSRSTDPDRGAGRTGAGRRGAGRASGTQGGRVPTDDEHAVLAAIDHTPTTFETILLRTGLSIAAAAEACDDLAASGAVRAGAGWWSRA